MGVQEVIGVAALGFLVFAGVSNYTQPPSSLAGKEPIHELPTKLELRMQKPSDAEGEVIFKDPATGSELGRYALGIDGLLYENPDKPNTRIFAEYRPSSYLVSSHFDAGGFAGIGDFAGEDVRATQLGVRYSPGRLGFQWLAPDLVASTEAYGAGVSIFPSSRAVGYPWFRLGVGAWYMAPWDGGRPGLVFGISTSTR